MQQSSSSSSEQQHPPQNSPATPNKQQQLKNKPGIWIDILCGSFGNIRECS